MNAVRYPQIDCWLLGATLLVALVIGGGTSAGLATDTMVQLLAVATAATVCLRNMQRRIDRAVFWFMIAAILCVIFQLLPLATDAIRSSQGILPDNYPLSGLEPVTVSLGLGRTIEVAVYLSILCLFLTAILKLRFEQVYGLIPFFLVGVVCNMAAALVQYSFARKAAIEDVLPYVMRVGFFANDNHFSTLVFASIPVAFAWFVAQRLPGVLLAYLAFSLLTLLAVGSRAGITIGLAVTALSALSFWRKSGSAIVASISGTVLVGVIGMVVWSRFQVGKLVSLNAGRTDIFRATLDGIADNLPFGIGYGNFLTAYPAYERHDTVFDKYVNHAHNDYLELAFEGGLPAILLIAAFLVLVLLRVVQTIHLPLQRAASLAVCVILIHSLVDYPLRTMALSVTFCLLLGLLFHAGPNAAPRTRAARV